MFFWSARIYDVESTPLYKGQYSVFVRVVQQIITSEWRKRHDLFTQYKRTFHRDNALRHRSFLVGNSWHMLGDSDSVSLKHFALPRILRSSDKTPHWHPASSEYLHDYFRSSRIPVLSVRTTSHLATAHLLFLNCEYKWLTLSTISMFNTSYFAYRRWYLRSALIWCLKDHRKTFHVIVASSSYVAVENINRRRFPYTKNWRVNGKEHSTFYTAIFLGSTVKLNAYGGYNNTDVQLSNRKWKLE